MCCTRGLIFWLHALVHVCMDGTWSTAPMPSWYMVYERRATNCQAPVLCAPPKFPESVAARASVALLLCVETRMHSKRSCSQAILNLALLPGPAITTIILAACTSICWCFTTRSCRRHDGNVTDVPNMG